MNLKAIIILIFLFFTYSVFGDEIVKNDDAVEDVKITVKDKDNYQVQIKQYSKEYPVVIYVVFKQSTPLLNGIIQILKQEIMSMSKKEGSKNNIIASAWFDDEHSDVLEKINLTSKYGAFIWVKEKKYVMNFYDYMQLLKREKDKEKKKKLLERNKEVQINA
ncbi:hypothetical protein [Candidatus Ruminimicrobium bovinum]|uniref:hypothetical protein n=1 Tax=Candidatus Ruminimicrobium bovinum TaxID=3242779 RepID=UPI0039B87285